MKWIQLFDAHGQSLSLQVQSNPPGFDQLVDRYLQNPALLQQAPPVPYEA